MKTELTRSKKEHLLLLPRPHSQHPSSGGNPPSPASWLYPSILGVLPSSSLTPFLRSSGYFSAQNISSFPLLLPKGLSHICPSCQVLSVSRVPRSVPGAQPRPCPSHIQTPERRVQPTNQVSSGSLQQSPFPASCDPDFSRCLSIYGFQDFTVTPCLKRF